MLANMDFKKIVGWLLLIAGLTIISYSLLASFNIFSGENPAPEIFSISAEPATPSPLSQSQQGAFSIQDVQNQMRKIIREQLKEFIPSDFLPTLFNLISWSIFAGILIFAGSQIAGLGIKLIK